MTNADDPIMYDENRPNKRNVLTNREYFAAFALQGWLSNPTALEELADMKPMPHGPSSMAQMAVTAADALIAELNK